MDKADVQAKAHGQRSKVKVKEVEENVAPISFFPDHNSRLNSPMATKQCTTFEIS